MFLFPYDGVELDRSVCRIGRIVARAASLFGSLVPGVVLFHANGGDGVQDLRSATVPPSWSSSSSFHGCVVLIAASCGFLVVFG